jgi:hypothetical protein
MAVHARPHAGTFEPGDDEDHQDDRDQGQVVVREWFGAEVEAGQRIGVRDAGDAAGLTE